MRTVHIPRDNTAWSPLGPTQVRHPPGETATAIHSAGAITSHIDDLLEQKATAIHFVIQPDDRRPAIVPRQAGVGCVTLDDLIGEKWVEVANRIDLGSRGIAPGEPECAHTTLHFAEYEARLLAQPSGACIAEPNDMITIVCAALRRLGAPGYHETRRRVRRSLGVGKRIK